MKKILVVDDMENWRKYHLARLNEIFGQEVKLEVADCAKSAYDMVYNNINSPYDLILSDLQMEMDFEPDFAGEWFVKRVKELSQYYRTRIFIVSASYDIKRIADNLGVSFIRKATAIQHPDVYKTIFD